MNLSKIILKNSNRNEVSGKMPRAEYSATVKMLLHFSTKPKIK